MATCPGAPSPSVSHCLLEQRRDGHAGAHPDDRQGGGPRERRIQPQDQAHARDSGRVEERVLPDRIPDGLHALDAYPGPLHREELPEGLHGLRPVAGGVAGRNGEAVRLQGRDGVRVRHIGEGPADVEVHALPDAVAAPGGPRPPGRPVPIDVKPLRKRVKPHFLLHVMGLPVAAQNASSSSGEARVFSRASLSMRCVRFLTSRNTA